MNDLNLINSLKRLSNEVFRDALFIRRKLHQFPELSWKEDETIKFLKLELEKVINPLFCIYEKKGGLIVDYTENSSYERDLFRADIDALPIEESTGLEFSSKREGIMHACGHDFHAAMLFAAIKAISNGNLNLSKNLRFIFQRAEEVPIAVSGGYCLQQEGLFDDVRACYALHIDSKGDRGVFKSKSGPMLANPCHVKLKVKADGGHVSRPHLGSNAIDLLLDIQLALREFFKQEDHLKDLVVYAPSILSAGVTCNVMPDHGEICFSLRNFLDQEKKKALLKKLEKMAHKIASKYKNGEIESFFVMEGFPVLVNDEQEYIKTKNLLLKANLKTKESLPFFAGEDFSYYLQKKPGVYWSIGAKQGQGFDHHTAQFNPDESVMEEGVLFWLLLATHDF